MIVTKLEERRKDFQKGIDFDEVRRKREEGSVQLRKIKRSEHIAKRRALTGKVAQGEGDLGDGLCFGPELISASLAASAPMLTSSQITDIERLDQVLNILVASEDPQTLLLAAEAIKKALSAEFNPPLVYVGNSPAARKLVGLLSCQFEPLLFEALWCITNLLSGPSSTTAHIVECDLLPALAHLLTHTSEDISDQAVWALSNIAGDSVSLRDVVIRLGVGEFIRDKLMHTSPLNVGPIGNMIWLISNLCRGVPPPTEDFVTSILSVIPKGFAMNKEEITCDTCWICSYITENGNRSGINQVLDLNVAPKLIELVISPSHKVQTPALRTLGNIATGDNHQMQVILSLGLLDKLSVVLTSRKKVARKEALWCLSNIAAGTPEQQEAVIRSPAMRLAIHSFCDPDSDIKREAAWVLVNIASSRDLEVHRHLASLGALRVLVQEMDQEDPKTLLVILSAIENVIRIHHKDGQFSEAEIAFEELGGINILERLQLNKNPKIYEKAVAVMSEFFGLMDVEEGQNAGAEMPRGGFQFT